MDGPLVSIVIPVLRDSEELSRLLAVLTSPSDEPPASTVRDDLELIVVNGDPSDPTLVEVRRRFSQVRWLEGVTGRAGQMNVGARGATGRWLWFLHADASPPPGWHAVFGEADRTSDVIGGWFRFSLASPVVAARLVEWGVRQRVRWLRLAYGDQGIFVRRDIFEAIGGYVTLPIMEDVDLVRRLAREGRLLSLPVALPVSARRWERDGWTRRSLHNMMLVILYYLGVPPSRLARSYAPYAAGTSAPAARAQPASPARGSTIGVVMPALNEEAAIGAVLAEMPAMVTTVVVADNGSTDATATRARDAGAVVVSEPRRGYGRACLAALREMDEVAEIDIVVFLDADRSDYPEELGRLVAPIVDGTADLVMGCRAGAGRPVTARFGTWLCVTSINAIWGTRYRDLGPFRAIRHSALASLGMTDETWGWTIEMQVKAAERGLRTREVPIRQRPRIGQSKISGTVVGTIRAGTRMLATIGSLWRTRRRRLAGSHD
jgi:rSAM/selenodomain-associated transferase 2